MEIGLIIIGTLILVGIVVLLFQSRKPTPTNDSNLLLIQSQINEISKTLETKLSQQSDKLNESLERQLHNSLSIVKDVTVKLTELEKTNQQVVSFADQLRSLQDILKNPKQRGILGEYYLESILKSVFPPDRYQLQYQFKNGEIVDAVVFLDKGKILPIDSKFSLENYNKIVNSDNEKEKADFEKTFKLDLKNRINETAKYIRPEENTMDFAFMFIPSEGIYYDLLINQVGAVKTSTRDLIEYAFIEKKVIIVSPTSFLAYLQTVIQGLRSLSIEEQARDIQKQVELLGRHLSNYSTYMEKVGSSLGTTINHYNNATKEFRQIDKDVFKITGGKMEHSVLAIDKEGDEN